MRIFRSGFALLVMALTVFTPRPAFCAGPEAEADARGEYWKFPSPGEQPGSNAAFGYLKADEAIKYPAPGELASRIKQIEETGWQDADGAMLGILQANQPCLANASQASTIAKCDFYFGKRRPDELQAAPPYGDLVNLGRLFLLEGIYEEHQKNNAKAVDAFLMPFKIAIRVAQNQDMVASAVATSMSAAAVQSLGSYLNRNPGLAKADLQKIRATLQAFRSRIFPARRFVELAENDWLASVRLAAGNKEAQVPGELSAVFLSKARGVGDLYYGKFLKAAESNRESDWADAQDALNELKARQESRLWKLQHSLKLLYARLTGGREAYNQERATDLLESLVLAGTPDLRKPVVMYNEMLQDLDALIKKVAQHSGTPS